MCQAHNRCGSCRAPARLRRRRYCWHLCCLNYGWWAIARKETPEHIIGFGGIAPLNYLTQRRINLGYRLAVEAWGQGYATELGRDALALAFDALSLPEVFGLVRPDHAASIRVLEKLGMQRFGLLDDVPGQASSLVFRVCHPTTAPT
ncbi:GNAT family N-acetyltransferase [Pseudomonas salmasensis]|uniref:GNAT family N-acetyltransferase n=1 Tax=Pseudomonas salmasensis TaxID=2745514 RepID=UPI00321922B0